ncbi:MAG: TolC family protein [Saprospiraceae bacterium]|nr:TolC family protein [Saprospiraceae bacterium]|tara:strand:+ start:2616 stop:3971 length:1356 start_codon:yes stop_codon:yes gene_type:complete
MVKKIRFFFCIVLYSTVGWSQSSILDKYIEEGLQNNLSLKSNDLDIKIRQSVISQTKKLWNPNVDLNGSYLLATGGRTIVFPVGDLFNPTYATLNQLTGTQQFPTDLENFESQLTPNNFLDVQFNGAKPLINSAIKYNQKIQNEILLIQELNKDITHQDITFQIKTAYYNYLKSFKGIATLEESLETLNELLKFNKVLVKYSKATEDAISDVDYRIANLESQKVGISEQQILAKALLNLLVNKPLDDDVNIDTKILLSFNPLEKELLDLKDEALVDRTEIKQLGISDKINTLNQSRIKKEGNPELNVFAGIGIQTEEFNFDGGGPLYTTGLSMSMNIIDGGLRKKKIEQLKFEREKIDNDKARLNQKIEIEITQNYYQIKSIESQIQSAESAERSAQKSYNILKTKYENDKILLIELLQAQNRLTSSQLNLDILKFDHLIKLAELNKLLGK